MHVSAESFRSDASCKRTSGVNLLWHIESLGSVFDPSSVKLACCSSRALLALVCFQVASNSSSVELTRQKSATAIGRE